MAVVVVCICDAPPRTHTPASRPMNVRGQLRIGISGWTYGPWRGTFFPAGLKQKDELSYASRKLNSIEVNGTFYSLQRSSSYASWYAQTPPGFLFALKGPRFITHILRLKDVRIPLANFFASGPLRLKEKLGPILWQFPPSFPYDRERVEAFFKLLPRTTKAAVRIARGHDQHVKHGTWLKAETDRPIRHAMEIRHPSFAKPDFVALLRDHDVGLVVADTSGKWPALEDVTSDFVYVRLHGASRLYVSGYTPAAIKSWAAKVQAWAQGKSPASPKRLAPAAKPAPSTRDVFVYFDNDVKTRSPYDAMSLAHALGVGQYGGEGPREEDVAEEPRVEWPPIARSLAKPRKRS
jgi:uncharacterized protein YecE (DUF72 family)